MQLDTHLDKNPSTQNNYPDWHPIHYMKPTCSTFLDIGCNVGDVMSSAHQLGAKEVFGVDINKAAIALAKERYPQFAHNISHGSADKLEYRDNMFDTITMCEVLEHIPNELRASVFSEINRILKPGGQLIITTPFRGLFHWMDPANIRFQFPQLFKLVSRTIGGNTRDNGFEGEKHGVVWHHHFTLQELESFIPDNFIVEHSRYRGVILDPITDCLLFPFYRLKKYDGFLFKMIREAKEWEFSFTPPPSLAFNIILSITKK